MTHFFSTLKNRRRYGTYDAETELRDKASAAISATTSETGIEHPVRELDLYKAIIVFDAFTGYVATTAEWRVQVEVSDIVGGTYTAVSDAIALVGSGSGRVEIPLSGGLIEYLDADSNFIRVTATKVGSPGDLTYGAFLVC